MTELSNIINIFCIVATTVITTIQLVNFMKNITEQVVDHKLIEYNNYSIKEIDKRCDNLNRSITQRITNNFTQIFKKIDELKVNNNIDDEEKNE